MQTVIAKHNVTIEIIDAKTKEVIDVRRTHNLVTIEGLNWLAAIIAGSETRPTNIALGTGLTAPAGSDTALENQVYTATIDRRLLDSSKVTHRIFVPTSEANGNTLAEEGLFRGSLLIARAAIDPAIVKTVAVELTIAHEITVS